MYYAVRYDSGVTDSGHQDSCKWFFASLDDAEAFYAARVELRPQSKHKYQVLVLEQPYDDEPIYGIDGPPSQPVTHYSDAA